MRNVCVFGDASTMPGFPTRLEQELRATAPPQLDVLVAAASNRDFQQWLGGSIVMSYGSVPGATREGYQEHGPARIAAAFSLDNTMPLCEEYTLVPTDVPGFDFAAGGGGPTGGSPTKGESTKGMPLEFMAKDLAHPEATSQAAHPSPLWTPLQFIGAQGAGRVVVKVGAALRVMPGSKGKLTPQHMVDQEDGPKHVFQRAPALELLHDKLIEAGVEVEFRNEPGQSMAFQLIFLDEQGLAFYKGSALAFQGIKESYSRFGTLHGSLEGAPPLEDMYENSQTLTLKQLSIFEELSKDPRQYVPTEYFAGLPALAAAWKACKKHYKL